MLEAQKEVAPTAEAIVDADEAQGIGIQAGFKVFGKLLLQLNLDINVQALEALITPKAMDVAIIEAEAEVAVGQERAADEEVVDGEVATRGANAKEAPDVAGVEAKVEVVPKVEEAD